jgi:hypothetical protein
VSGIASAFARTAASCSRRAWSSASRASRSCWRLRASAFCFARRASSASSSLRGTTELLSGAGGMRSSFQPGGVRGGPRSGPYSSCSVACLGPHGGSAARGAAAPLAREQALQVAGAVQHGDAEGKAPVADNHLPCRLSARWAAARRQHFAAQIGIACSRVVQVQHLAGGQRAAEQQGAGGGQLRRADVGAVKEQAAALRCGGRGGAWSRRRQVQAPPGLAVRQIAPGRWALSTP